MKKVKWIFLLLIPHLLWGQKTEYEYVPFQDGGIWSVNNMKYMTAGDTVINEKSYMKVYQQEQGVPFEFDLTRASYFCAIRNDSINKKIFGIYHTALNVIPVDYNNNMEQSTDTSEFLLYDFSLGVGDTIIVASFFFGNYVELWRVVREENITIYGENDQINLSNQDSLMTMKDGSIRKRILLDIVSEYYFPDLRGTQMWIEGIGSSNGLFTHSQTTRLIADIPYTQLLCFQEKENLLYQTELTSFDENGDCFGGGFGGNIKETSNFLSNINVYPNPTNGNLHIESSNTIINYIEIYDIMGKIILSKEIHALSNKINISSLPNSIYLMKIYLDNGEIVIRKIMKN